MALESIQLPSRRWECLYRLLHFCGARVAEHQEVMKRRTNAGVTDHPKHHNFAWEDRAAEAPEAIAVVDQAVSAWCELFDMWFESCNASGIASFVFPDVYAVGYFLAVLHCDDAVYYRGQRTADWGLITSRTRVLQSDLTELHRRDQDAIVFMNRLKADKDVLFYYEGAAPLSEHLVAATQHYGFPTHYLDLTTEFEVAAYFAEGGSDDWQPKGGEGAIYALPASSLPWESTRLVTLPPCFMRPRLQRGVFLFADPDLLDLPSFEQTKFRFRHTSFPLRRSAGNLRWGKYPGLSEFYFPVQDQFESWCQSRSGSASREDLMKRWHDQWLRETYDLCIHDRGHNLAWANDHHLRLRCRCEPVLAVRTTERLIRSLSQQAEDYAQPVNSGLVFFLKALTGAILHEDVTPPRMRERVLKLMAQTAWLRA